MHLVNVYAWRASGERAVDFSHRGVCGEHAALLGVEAQAHGHAQCTKRPAGARGPDFPDGRIDGIAEKPIILEVVSAGVRNSIELGADARTLAMVLEVVRGGGR